VIRRLLTIVCYFNLLMHLLRKEDDDCMKKCMEYLLRVPDQEEDERGPGERLWRRTVKRIK